jgi:hypothetical protein
MIKKYNKFVEDRLVKEDVQVSCKEEIKRYYLPCRRDPEKKKVVSILVTKKWTD